MEPFVGVFLFHVQKAQNLRNEQYLFRATNEAFFVLSSLLMLAPWCPD